MNRHYTSHITSHHPATLGLELSSSNLPWNIYFRQICWTNSINDDDDDGCLRENEGMSQIIGNSSCMLNYSMCVSVCLIHLYTKPIEYTIRTHGEHALHIGTWPSIYKHDLCGGGSFVTGWWWCFMIYDQVRYVLGVRCANDDTIYSIYIYIYTYACIC